MGFGQNLGWEMEFISPPPFKDPHTTTPTIQICTVRIAFASILLSDGKEERKFSCLIILFYVNIFIVFFFQGWGAYSFYWNSDAYTKGPFIQKGAVIRIGALINKTILKGEGSSY